jgi:alpha-ketoglutarate-dependent taurine dioxygenase
MDESESMSVDLERPALGRRKAIHLSPEVLIKERFLDAQRTLPLVIEPAVESLNLAQWAPSNREFIRQRLQRHGGILFRGFNVSSVNEFELFLKSIAGDLLEYSYRSTPRSQVSGRIYTSTEYPAHETIPLHNEMAYTSNWPMIIGFFCLEVAPEGGETPIADSRNVLKLIDPAIRDRFAHKKVMYVRNYGDTLDLSWQNVFQTEDPAEVEAYCRSAEIEFEWKGNNELSTWQVCQAIATHPDTDDVVWFNQAHLFHTSSLKPEIRESLLSSAAEQPPRNAYYGDGSPIEDETLEEIRSAYAKETVMFPWQERDVLLLDNMLAAHGRRPYRGPRKIVVGMGHPFQDSEAV